MNYSLKPKRKMSGFVLLFEIALGLCVVLAISSLVFTTANIQTIKAALAASALQRYCPAADAPNGICTCTGVFGVNQICHCTCGCVCIPASGGVCSCT